MGLSFRRKKSSKQLSSRSQSSQALASTPTPNAYSVSNSINDNSTIATKQSVYSKSKLQQQYQQYPTYATEEEAPPQSLPPLGLSGAVVDPSDMAAGGSSHSNNVNARNINAWQEQAAAAAVGDDPSARRGSTGTDSVFDGLTLTSNRDSPMLYQQEQEVVMKQRPSRDATPTMNMRKQIMPPHHQESTTWQSNHSNTTTGRREPLQPQPKQFDPPPQSDPPAEQSKQMKARKLRVAMRREISRHRNGGSSSRQQQQQYKKTAAAQPPIVASARNNNLNMTTKIADIPSRPERSRDESLALTSAAYSRAESKTSRRSNNTTASRSTARTRTMKGAAAAGAVGATAVGAGMAASMARRNGKSYVDETTTLGDEDSAVPNDYSEFPKVKEEDDEEDISVHASSFCSCGTTYDEDNETDNNTKDETMTYDEDGTYASGTYLDDDDATYETYESYEEDINHRRRHTTPSSSRRRLENNRSIDEESYLDDEASYMDGSIGTYLSEDDGEEDRSKRSVDPPAKDGTWASWFGFGGGGDANNEEEIAMMEDDTLMSPSDDGTREDDGTLDVDDGSTISHDQSTLGTKETVEDEETVDYEVRVPDGVNQQQQQQQQQQQDHLVASERTQVARNHNMSAAQSYDREGRPLLMEGATLPESKSMRRVSSFKKGWKMLKAPGSPGGSSIGKSTRSVGGGDKTVTTNDTPATVSTTYSKASSKDTSKVENTRNGGSSSSSATAADKAAEKDAKLWDTDERQRDLYCTKHGGVDMLTIRQYDAVPTPARPDHLLIKIEASTVSSKDCAIRLKGEPNTPPSPAVPGFHAVGTVAAIGTAVKSSSFKHGNRVAALLPNGGGNAKYISIPKTSAVLLPEDAHHKDIICLVANYMTAYQCLKLSKKDAMPLTNANVLITGGSGPVGQALVELALREGAKVYATAHKMHEEHLTKLGAKWFSVKPKKWLPHLEGKMDVVIDSLCIDGYESSYRALTPEGTLVCNTGNVSAQQLQDSSGSDSWIDTEGLNSWWNVQKAKYVWSRAIFYDLNESYAQNPKMFAHELHYLICKLQRGEIQPKVAGKVSLNQVPKAQKLIEKGLPNGTVVCLPWKKLDPKQKVKVEKKNVK